MFVVSLLLVMYVSFVILVILFFGFFFQAEDGIRDLVRSRGLGDVYKRQMLYCPHGREVVSYIEGCGKHYGDLSSGSSVYWSDGSH